jgi:hypothetical protein
LKLAIQPKRKATLFGPEAEKLIEAEKAKTMKVEK